MASVGCVDRETILTREQLTEKLRGWVRASYHVELEEFLEGYRSGRFRQGHAQDLASLARFLGLDAERSA